MTNVITLCGRLTKDSVINQSGKVADNCIAIDRLLKDQNGNKQTDYINVKWIGEKKTQFAEKYMTKGRRILIVGRLQVDSYKDKEGNNRQYSYVLVDTTEFVESKAAAGQTTQPQGRQQEKQEEKRQEKQEETPKPVSSSPMDMFNNDDFPFN